MTQYTPTNTPSRPPRAQDGSNASPPSPDIVTRTIKTGYRYNGGGSLTHDRVDDNWIALDGMAQGGQYWPLYKGLFLKNRGLDTEGGIFVDNPYNNGATGRFSGGYINHRIEEEDSDFGVTLAQGDFLSYKGDLYLKDGSIKYGTKVSFVDSALDSAMTVTGTDVYFGKGSTGNANSAQVRIGKLNGNRVEIGSLNNVLNQTTILQIGAAGPTNAENKSGFIKAKQTVVNPPHWDMSFHTYNGNNGSVEAITIAPDGAVSIPNIASLISTGPVNLGSAGDPSTTGLTTIKGDLVVDGTFTYTGSGVIGVSSIDITNASNSELNITQNGTGGNVTVTADVATGRKIPLSSEVNSWNGVVSGTVPAPKATVLASAVTLWGQSFDGSANISGNLQNVEYISSTNNTDLVLIAPGIGKIINHTSSGKYHFRNPTNEISVAFEVNNAITASRTYTLPDKDGTVAMLSDVAGSILGTANNWSGIQNFNAGLSGELTGNASTATNATKLNNLVPNANNVESTIVQRNGNGDFAAGKIWATRFVGTLEGTVEGGVTVSTPQTITGVKTFSSILKCSNDIDFISGPGKITQLDSDETIDFLVNQPDTAQLSVSSDGIAVGGNIVSTGYAIIGGNAFISGPTFTAKKIISSGGIDFPADIDADIRQLALGKSIRFFTGPNNADEQLKISSLGVACIRTFSSLGKLSAFSGADINGVVTIGRNTPGGPVAGSLYVQDEILCGGDITAFFTSDKRLKDNIVPIENALDKVAALSGNTFDWNDKTDKVGSETGVIAQEVEALGLPDVVTERENGYLAVRYEKLIPLLIEAIKELKAEVEELKA